ncbi:MAG: hypothetical protein JWO47_777 [Candidatus Saccharibacteria bacterium]|nr:hypothetical protein [Candidatus Saccharibacteria bacterium]
MNNHQQSPKRINNWVFKRGAPIRRAAGENYEPAKGVPGAEAARTLIEIFIASGQELNENDQRKFTAAKRLFGIADPEYAKNHTLDASTDVIAATVEVQNNVVSQDGSVAGEAPQVIYLNSNFGGMFHEYYTGTDKTPEPHISET